MLSPTPQPNIDEYFGECDRLLGKSARTQDDRHLDGGGGHRLGGLSINYQIVVDKHGASWNCISEP
ncbi:hypothetical protein [Microcoleus sp. BROC3]|uniref:hypothetical protein n=1 Tax=Microcoleus sp. BROC3 TaxID=3055323 RepID=UPI002FD37907